MLSKEKLKQIESELSGDERIEATYRRLRRDGYSRLEAIRALLEMLDLSLPEAKEVLLTNETWAEVQSATVPQEPSSEEQDDEPPLPPAPA